MLYKRKELIDAKNLKQDTNSCLAKYAVEQADTLINELNKTETK